MLAVCGGADDTVKPDAFGPNPDRDGGSGGRRSAAAPEPADRHFADARDGAPGLEALEPPGQNVLNAHEFGDEAARRTIEQVARRAFLRDPAATHEDHPIAHRQRLLLTVRDVYEGEAELTVQFKQFHLHVQTQLLVERAERLVEQEDRRPGHDGPGQRNTLALTAAQLVNAPVVFVGEADKGKHLADAVFPLDGRDAADLQPVTDILGDRHVREQRVVLEHRRAVSRRRMRARHLYAGDAQARQSASAPRGPR